MSNTKRATALEQATISWESLKGKITPEIFQAPKTVGDLYGSWPPVHERNIRYLLRNADGKAWMNHLSLMAAVLSARRLDVYTVELTLRMMHSRFTALLPALGLETMDGWNVDLHLPAYLKGELLPHDTEYMRFKFLQDYLSATKHVKNWLEALPQEDQRVYRPYVLAPVNPLAIERLDKRQEIEQQQRQRRKAETEAVVPHFGPLRAEAHFRYNRLMRLRQAYQQALKKVLPDHSNLPLEFSYAEGDPPVERLFFKLWDRRSFVLDSEHAERYTRRTIDKARLGRNGFTDERNVVFLEFLKAEPLVEGIAPEGLWFADLLRVGVLGNKPRFGSPEEVRVKQTWLRQWGYGEDETLNEFTIPFSTNCPGLLTWPDEKKSSGGSLGQFMDEAQKRTTGALIPVETLYAAATFGLLSIDLVTSTGMRLNELQQVSLSPQCLIRLVDEPPPGAKDQSPRIRYLLRLLPKGERTETLHNYGIGRESVKLIERTAQMLCEYYQVQLGEALPRVPFDPRHHRQHRFEEIEAPYLFQYTYQHLGDRAIHACMRFLMHGMVFQDSQGKPVVLKPHLLRHAFATYAVHVEGMPIDLVAKWLQQKSLEVTKYYSEMPEYMQLEQHSSFVARLATQINVREAILRSPEEIRKQAEEARRRVGTLVPVCGGECILDAYCPNQFDCVHCPAKAPDPEKRYQVEEKKRWAQERFTYYEQEGLVLEAEKMKQLLRACELELKEMEMIVAYRKDEVHVIQIQPRPKRPS